MVAGMGMSARTSAVSGESRRARGIAATPEDPERPNWPPKAGTKIALYLPEAPDPAHQYLVEVDDLHGSILAVTAPSGVEARLDDGATPAVKILFPGRRWSWGYDAELTEIDRLPVARWHLRIVRGPVPVERRDSERVAHREIVMVKQAGRNLPAHMLDRSEHGMRCITGRGNTVNMGDVVTVEVDVAAGDVVHGAEVVWRRLAINGLEFGLTF